MHSFGQAFSPRAVVWVSMREAERATEVLDRTRRALDDDEVEALATRRAEARRARRQASEAAAHLAVHPG
jgi:hypothetical protein